MAKPAAFRPPETPRMKNRIKRGEFEPTDGADHDPPRSPVGPQKKQVPVMVTGTQKLSEAQRY